MEPLTVECLRCGTTRPAPGRGAVNAGECGRCGYVGWAATPDLSENVRRALRDRPPERRRLRAVA